MPAMAVLAGVVSATSPCVLPVIPGFLAAVASPARADERRPAVAGALAFAAGFAAVFVALGAAASAIGSILYDHLTLMLQVAGALLVLLGLQMLGVVRWRLLTTEHRAIALERVAGGPRRAILLGAVFAAGWTPCVGPVLAVILTKAAADASLTQGVLLLAAYSAGLGAPFLLAAVWFDRSARARHWISRHARSMQSVTGAVMVASGVLYASGAWSAVFVRIQAWLARAGWPPV